MDRIVKFAQLDAAVGRIKDWLNIEVQGEIIRAAREAGSIDRMPEPYRSWLAMEFDELPPEVLEINYGEVVAAREMEEPPA